MLKLLLILFFSLSLYANKFTIASYNVENLFDLKKQNSEYTEYIPNTKALWNKKNFNVKINNVVKVIKDLDADIIALQEIENISLIKLLQQKLPKYKYISFTKYNNSSIGLGFLSKIKIKNSKKINVYIKNKKYRPILEATFKIKKIEFKIFNNHWPSKRAAESYRIKYAKVLQDRVKLLAKDYDYILLGDFNSNYDEMQSFRHNKKLNNTYGITGINQVLNTTINKDFITLDDVLKTKKRVHFNLWLDLQVNQRFSSKFRKQNNTPDNIILSPALFDTKNLSYIKNSFKVFKPSYLFSNKKINRWKMKGPRHNKRHIGSGFSDHLPIYAKFSISKKDRNPLKIIKNNINQNNNTNNHKITYLYKKTKLIEPVILKNVIVIYKDKKNVIIKQKNNRAIYLYNNAQELKLGYSYDLQINQIKNYHDLKEVTSFFTIKEKQKDDSYKELFLDARNIDILDLKYQNEIIKNLKGKMKNSKLYFDNKRIKIFAKNKKILPKNNQVITIINGHLGIYRGNPQILLHKKSDYKVEF